MIAQRSLFFTVSQVFVLMVLALPPLGCMSEDLEFTEVKRLDEKVTEEELATLLRILDSLPEKKLPDMPPVFAPPPVWNQARTLPVHELITEERALIDEHWSVEWLARSLQRNRPLLRPLLRALRREEMTPEQFVGLTLTVGVAMSRSTLRDQQDLQEISKRSARDQQEISKRGKTAINRLRGTLGPRPFSSLSREASHFVLHQAVWLTRIDRANQMALVPPETIMMVREHWDDLAGRFPEQFTTNPLDAVVDLLEERGMPFEELGDSDEQIEWDPEMVIVGHDEPDSEVGVAAPEAAKKAKTSSE
jgi:hypothetical protein